MSGRRGARPARREERACRAYVSDEQRSPAGCIGGVGATIRVVDIDQDGHLRPERVRDALSPRTRLVAFSHVSNVLGLVNPAADICAVARARRIPVLIDAA